MVVTSSNTRHSKHWPEQPYNNTNKNRQSMLPVSLPLTLLPLNKRLILLRRVDAVRRTLYFYYVQTFAVF